MPVRNAPSQIPTTLRFMASRLARRFGNQGDPAALAGLESRLQRVGNALQDAGIVSSSFHVTAGGEWLDTGIDLEAGESVSVLADGMVWLAKGLDVGFGPQVGLWYRVGDAPLRKASGAHSWLDTGSGGRLRFTTKPPGEFADRDGRFEAGLSRKPLKGGFTLAVQRWPRDLDTALAQAIAIDASLFAPLTPLLATPARTPEGWHYLWRLGDGRIFNKPEQSPQRRLCCDTHADVGILQYPVDHPLDADTRLDWRWCVQQLPSRFAEHTAPTHDYLSIAVEFDNGLDLTYLWSVSLPVDTIFQCPLPWWDKRETHWVIRSGTLELGQWLGESRAVLADYRRAIGGPEPSRIVGVWLIANSAFQRGTGRCQYEAITLNTGGRADPVG